MERERAGRCRLIVAHEGGDAYVDALRERFANVEARVCRNPDELAATLERFTPEIAYSCVTPGFPRQAHRPLLQASSLRWLHIGGSGFEHLADRDPSRMRLSNGRGALAGFQADTVMGAILALNQNILRFHALRSTRRLEPRTFKGLAGRRLAIIGPGAVGTAVAIRARAHGLVTIASARQAGPRLHFDEVHPFAQLPATLASADIVSLHLPLTEATRHLLDVRILGHLRPHAMLINTARGAIVDEQALAEALAAGRIAAAYLDVFEREPLAADSPLWQLDNVLITPHCADQVEDWQERHAALFMDNLERWLDGRPLINEIA